MANDDKSYPKKYWWVVAVAVPLAVAIIAAVPSWRGGDGGAAGSSATITGNNNTVSFDYSTRNTFITNVAVIAKEYEALTGRPLDDDLRRQIEQAVNAALQNNHGESIRLFERISGDVPVPAVYNNLGVAYAKVDNREASEKAFAIAKAKIAEVTEAAARNRPLSATNLRAPAVSGPAVRSESSAVPGLVIDPLAAPYLPPGEIHVVDHGTATAGSYQVRYRPEPGVTVVMNPGAYDILFKVSSFGAGFMLASNVVVKEGALTRVNPNALVGGLAIEGLNRQGFPPIKRVEIVDVRGGQRLLAQSSDSLGVTLAIAPGTYEVLLTTDDDQHVPLASTVTVKAGDITRLDTPNQVAAIVVRTPQVRGLAVKAVYALKAGTNEIASKVDGFEKPLLVAAGETFDIGLEQAAGLTRIRTAVKPGRGELVDIR